MFRRDYGARCWPCAALKNLFRQTIFLGDLTAVSRMSGIYVLWLCRCGLAEGLGTAVMDKTAIEALGTTIMAILRRGLG